MTDYNEEKCVEMKQTTPLPAVTVEAMAYVPYQQYKTIYSAEKGLENGTIFPELDKPFLGTKWRDMKLVNKNDSCAKLVHTNSLHGNCIYF